jgi:hypothetical protein
VRNGTRWGTAGLLWAAVLLFSRPLLATPVQLPASEDPALWDDPLAVAGLVPGPPGEAEWIAVRGVGDSWVLQVRDRSGRLHQLAIDRPRTASEREDLLWLALSLLEPPAGGDAWEEPPPSEPTAPPDTPRREATPPRRPEPDLPAPEPAPPSTAIEPDPIAPRIDPVDPSPIVPSEPLAPEPLAPVDAEPAVPEPLAPVDAEPAVPEPPASAPSVDVPSPSTPWPAPRPRFYASLGGGADVPTSSTPTVDLRGGGGIDVQGWLRIGGVVASRAPSVLYAPSDSRWMGGWSLLSTIGFDVGRRRPVWLTVGFGGHRLDLHGTRTRADLSLPGVTIAVPGTTTRASAGGVAASFGVSVPRRLGEHAVLDPFVLLQFESFDPDDVRGEADVLVPLSLRVGIQVTLLRHGGAGLPESHRRGEKL